MAKICKNIKALYSSARLGSNREGDMTYLYVYLLALIPSFVIAFCQGVARKGRIEDLEKETGWHYYAKQYREGLKLLVHDHFLLHYPWSWEISKRYRVSETRRMLGPQGLHHNTLGHLTQARCDNPALHERIASECYISRFGWWLGGIRGLLLSPIPAFTIVINMLIQGVGSLTARRSA